MPTGGQSLCPARRAAPVTRATRPDSSSVSGCSVVNGNVSSLQTCAYSFKLSSDPLLIGKVIDIDVSIVCIVGAEGGREMWQNRRQRPAGPKAGRVALPVGILVVLLSAISTGQQGAGASPAPRLAAASTATYQSAATLTGPITTGTISEPLTALPPDFAKYAYVEQESLPRVRQPPSPPRPCPAADDGRSHRQRRPPTRPGSSSGARRTLLISTELWLSNG